MNDKVFLLLVGSLDTPIIVTFNQIAKQCANRGEILKAVAVLFCSLISSIVILLVVHFILHKHKSYGASEPSPVQTSRQDEPQNSEKKPISVKELTAGYQLDVALPHDPKLQQAKRVKRCRPAKQRPTTLTAAKQSVSKQQPADEIQRSGERKSSGAKSVVSTNSTKSLS